MVVWAETTNRLYGVNGGRDVMVWEVECTGGLAGTPGGVNPSPSPIALAL